MTPNGLIEISNTCNHPTMRYLPFGCFQIYHSLAVAMFTAGVTTFRPGGSAPTSAGLARILSCEEADVVRCLEPLVEAGFLSREEDGGLTCPLLVRQAERRRQDALRKQRRIEVRAAREAEFQAAHRSGTIAPATTRKQFASTKNGRGHRDPSQRDLGLNQVVAGTDMARRGPNPSSVSGSMDLSRGPGPCRSMDLVHSGVDQGPSRSMDLVHSGVDQGPSRSMDLVHEYPVQIDGQIEELFDGAEDSINPSVYNPARARMDRGPGPQSYGPGPQVHESMDQPSPGGRRLSNAEARDLFNELATLARLPVRGWGDKSRDAPEYWMTLGLTREEMRQAVVKRLARTPGPVRGAGWITDALEDAAREKRAGAEQNTVASVEAAVADPEPRGTRLAEDWTPGDAGYRFAEDLALDPDTVLANFRDYWRAKPGKDGRKTDWGAAWRFWCRNEKPGRGGARNVQGSNRFAAWDQLAENLAHRSGVGA